MERYYGRRFTNKKELVQMIKHYICYYNTRRVQRNLGVLPPWKSTSCISLHKKRPAAHLCY
ncbi:IS3 family transposase [Butyricicoccus pullicaecorum]|uniref:IS3 family transposase n=1 Tax=Butyricicoccus pullicaecorum TaxID=501571 RepID=UPI0038B27FBB